MTQQERDYIIMRPIHEARKKVYYFDTNGIYSSIPKDEITQHLLKGIFVHKNGDVSINIASYYLYGCNNLQISQMALVRLKEGDTIERFEELLATCKPAPRNSRKPQGIDAFICKIDTPIFYRSSDNPNTNTFDYIYIDVSILSQNAMNNRDEYLKEHINEIRQKVAEKLNNSREFKRYDVPINFLRVCRTTLKRKSNILQFVFELKLQDFTDTPE